jgi:hypothetical protein
MACWESGLDFSAYLILFAELVVNCEYLIALEAATVIDEMYNLTDISNVKKALELLAPQRLTTDKQDLVAHTISHLNAIAAQDGST